MSNLFLQGMLWCDMVKTWCDIRFCMRWSCFVISTTGRSLMVVSLLYEMQTPCNCFTLSLCVSNSCRSNTWRNDHDATMEIKVSSRWRWRSWRCFGDGDQRHKMIMAISCHILWLHVMFIFYASYLALIDGSIIRWTLIIKKCSPWVCTVAKVLRAETPRDDRVW